MKSLAEYVVEAKRLVLDEFRAQFPAPILMARQILGGELIRHQRELTWLEQIQTVGSITLLHITDSSKLLHRPVDRELMRTRVVNLPLCISVQKTTNTSIYGEEYDDLRPWPDNALTVGRFHNTDIVINDYTVSKVHAWFVLDPITNSYWLTDAGSTNGTWVGSHCLRKGERSSVLSGQRVTIGRLVFQFFVADDFYRFCKSLGNRSQKASPVGAYTSSR
jgi:hypothetical protein